MGVVPESARYLTRAKSPLSLRRIAREQSCDKGGRAHYKRSGTWPMRSGLDLAPGAFSNGVGPEPLHHVGAALGSRVLGAVPVVAGGYIPTPFRRPAVVALAHAGAAALVA